MTAQSSAHWPVTFPPEREEVGRARRALTDTMREAGAGDAVIAQACIVLSELVSNGVRHARSELTVRVTVADGTIRIEVFDRDTRPPLLLGLDAESTGGRGLHIVASIARDWGWHTARGEAGGSGKVVWAELALDPGTFST